MKPPTVFLGEMTNPEVEAFLKKHHTVIVPTGATEQHGPHGPLLTDVLIPQEIARRIAPADRRRRRAADQLRAVVSARRVHRARADPHSHVHGAHRGPVRLVRHVRLQAHHFSERPLRQHLRDRLRVRQRGREAVEGRQGVSGQLLGRHDGRRDRGVLRIEERAARQSGRDVGDPRRSIPTWSTWTRPMRSSRRFPTTPSTRGRCTPRFSSPPRDRCSGPRNPARGGRAQVHPGRGRALSRAGVRSTLAVLENIEATFKAMPPR